jgi:hypothetical protein
MAFPNNWILSNGVVISFAEYADVTTIDQRVFEANEGLTQAVVEDALIRATTRIVQNLGASDWWRSFYMRMNGGTYNPIVYNGMGLFPIPDPEPNKILVRQADFTDLCVYYALSYYIYPKIADFSNQDNAERIKIGFMNEKYRSLFQELIDDGSWYDWNNGGTVTDNEKLVSRTNIIRAR